MEVRFSKVPETKASLIALKKALFPVTMANMDSVCFVDDTYKKTPRPYPKVRRESSIVMKNSGFSFFTNFGSDPILPEDLDFRIVPVDEVFINISSQFTIEWWPIGNELWFEIKPLMNSTLFRGFYFIIFHPVTGIVNYISRPFYHMPEEYQNYLELEFHSPRGVLYNFPYPDAGERRNRIGIMGNIAAVEYPDSKEVYKEVITGKSRLVSSTLDRELKIETYYQDYYAHEALAFAFFHESLKINGVPCVTKDAYKPNMEKDSDLSSGEVVVVDQDFTQKIKSC